MRVLALVFVDPKMSMSYRLAQRSALANCDLVTLLNTESGADVSCEICVSLLISGIFWDEV